MRIKSTRLLTTACLSLILSGCNFPSSIAQPEVTYTTATKSQVIWANGFQTANWMQRWGVRKQGDWGLKNIVAIADPSGKFSQVLRVRYPSGSASPLVTRKTGAPVGGAQFFANLGMQPQNALRLSYYVRFANDFDFVKGGKLPGLFGGTVTDGRQIPDGTNGFSTRYMWRRGGEGEIYAYLPSSKEHGTSIGRGNWRFRPGIWYRLEQEVVLNQPGQNNGRIRVWVDGKLVLNRGNLNFRTSDRLKIEGILFSTFFGGGAPSWATPKNVYADFANFSVSRVN